VKRAIPALAALADGIGDRAVRNRGTIGGSISNNDPAADFPAACLALGATIVTDRRKVVADDFFTGLFETALESDEIVTGIHFPLPKSAAYIKFPSPASRYALVGVFVARSAADVRLAVTGASQSGVFRWRAAEAKLTADFSSKSLDALTCSEAQFVDDIHGDALYRAHLTRVLSQRAVASAH
jgi:carbon-monoxide dehydrogenase medium subunit